MRKIQYIYTLIGAAMLLLTSAACSNEHIESASKQMSGLTLSLSVDGMATESATRASIDAAEGENNVGTLHLFFFNYTENEGGMLVDFIKLDNPSLSTSVPLTTAGTDLSASHAYNIIGVANVGNYVDDETIWAESWAGNTEAYFRANAVGEIAGATDNTQAISADALLMNGTTVKKAGDGNVSLTLSRNLARFDVVNNISESHTLVSISIWNAFTQSSITGDFIPDYSSNNTSGRTARFYGVENSSGATSVMGTLYAFENISPSPATADHITTSLVIGLEDASGAIGYHRVNINPAGTVQTLKRNKVYRLAITGVAGSGAESQEEAYSSANNYLNYTINNWDLGENGLIVSDPYSILAVPTKTIQIAKAGGTLQYTITTFSTLANPAPLSISSTLPTGIEATLSGNQLMVTASDLGSVAERNGTITLSYANLQATVNVVQSPTVGAYLELVYAHNWSEVLSAAAGAVSQPIYVRASDSWTAKFFGEEGFAFINSAGEYITEITSAEAANSTFSIYTSSANTNKYDSRRGFVLVSLDSDPVNYVAVVTVYQATASEITIDPIAEGVTFDGGGNATTTNSFTVTSTSGSISNISINSDLFSYTFANDVLTVTATGINSSSANYTATLTVTDSYGSTSTIGLTQLPLVLEITAAAPTTVDTDGGSTGLISVNIADATATWTVSIDTKGVSRSIFSHYAYLVDENGNALSTGYIDTPFKVVFPRILFPNRETDIIATVTVTTNNGATATYAVTQNKLASKGVHVWSSIYSAYGSIAYSTGGVSTGAYYFGFNTGFRARVLQGISSSNQSVVNGTSLTAGNYNGSTIVTGGSNATSYVHISSYGMTASVDWSYVKAFMEDVDGVTLFMSSEQASGPRNAINNSPLSDMGYTFSAAGVAGQGAGNTTLLNTDDANVASSRIYQFLVTYGNSTISSPSALTFYSDAINTSVLASSNLPETAIPVLKYANGNYALVIDPANKVVFHGESSNFHDGMSVSGRYEFVYNFSEYLGYAAMYGSNFTDMLRDDLTGDNAIAPMWDTDTWGSNAWSN